MLSETEGRGSLLYLASAWLRYSMLPGGGDPDIRLAHVVSRES